MTVIVALMLNLALSAPALPTSEEPGDEPVIEGAETPPSGETPQEARERGRGWNDRRRTVRSYGANLGYDAIRVFAKPNWLHLGIGVGLGAGASLLDSETVAFFGRNRMKTLGDVGASAGGTGAVAILGIGLFSAGRIAPGETFRSATYDASQAILIDGVYTFVLKGATRRLRPDGSNRQSFPSGHASEAFAWATVFAEHYGPKVGVPAYTAASLIAASRLAKNKHYLSDVVIGATLGHLVGRAVVRGNSRPASGVPAKPVLPNPAKPSARIVPAFGPNGGSGLGIVVNF